MPRRKPVRDSKRLSGKSLSETLEPSDLNTTFRNAYGSREGGQLRWVTSHDLYEENLSFSVDIVYNMMLFVLANPNMNSSHLYRADILYDSLGRMETPREKEVRYDSALRDDRWSTGAAATAGAGVDAEVEPIAWPAEEVSGFHLTRTVVRKLIPRKPNLDPYMDQTAHFYEDVGKGRHRLLVIYLPHIQSKNDMPWYHPLVRSLAFLYDLSYDAENPSTVKTWENEIASPQGTGIMSVHFLPFDSEPMPLRLERTLLALLNNQIRLARGTRSDVRTADGANYNPSKDNVVPQHLVQDTYSRLKLTYAHDLCQRWVEDTMPSKHVFEDLAITAFLIELWRSMYGAIPAAEKKQDEENTVEETRKTFPGFVDVACGNGVLVYVLLMEGYSGWGFDARRRKTWSIFPDLVQECLTESVYVPVPFADAADSNEDGDDTLNNLISQSGVDTHTGTFKKDTFIISNHADELTVWTPLMAMLACPESPLPFIAIPCCSHSLSGARFRYPPPYKQSTLDDHDRGNAGNDDNDDDDNDRMRQQEERSAKGDLKALRAEKLASQTAKMDDNNTSMYASLTAKTMNIARDVGYDVEKTLLRIPSTRNMCVIGGRKRITKEWTMKRQNKQPDSSSVSQPALPSSALCTNGASDGSGVKNDPNNHPINERVWEVVSRECQRDGGIECAAKTWVNRAIGIHRGSSRKVEQEH